ncbi:MAG: S26 family signal peptidase [Haloarculaceae archaeon]
MSEPDGGPERDRDAGPRHRDRGVDPDGSVGSRTPREWVHWFLETDQGVVAYVREVLSSVLAVLLVGLVLFGVSGLWPPMVAIESPSMNPHMKTGDLVFVMEEHRFPGGAAYADTGVVTHRTGERTGYRKFGMGGDVIVYEPDGNGWTTPIIHRAMFYVNASEDWYEKAVEVDPEAVGNAEDCGALENCPAPHAGFITKGDNERTNRRYDQVSGLSDPVKPAWVVGTAEFRIPWLGNIRLWTSQTGPFEPGTVDARVGTASAEPTGPNASTGTAFGTSSTPTNASCAWA